MVPVTIAKGLKKRNLKMTPKAFALSLDYPLDFQRLPDPY
jgi:hypothetical protein